MAKPIIFATKVTVRFSDLDVYGHVNSSCYLDYVISSRLSFSKAQTGWDNSTFIKRGIGFYLAQAESHFLAPVVGIHELSVASWVEQIDGPQLHTPYEIKLPDEKVASRGKLRFTVVDLNTRRPTNPPDWVIGLFQESAA